MFFFMKFCLLVACPNKNGKIQRIRTAQIRKDNSPPNQKELRAATLLQMQVGKHEGKVQKI